MKFSIREMLALTFVVVLGMLAGRSLVEVRQDQERLAALQAEIETLEVKVRLDKPAFHQAMLNTKDEFESIREIRNRAIEHFELIREKYSTMEPAPANVLAIRGIPALRIDEKPVPVVFRLLVPEERKIWLKYGVHPVKQSVHSSRSSDQESDLLTESPFNDSGPFEIRLPAGDQRLKVDTGVAEQGSLPFEVRLGDEVLLRSAFVSNDVHGSGSGHISVLSQSSFPPRRTLPWLLSTNIDLRDPVTGDSPVMSFAFSLWLSDHKSNFPAFPGKAITDGSR